MRAVQRAERGLVDADLGGGVIKQRIAREGQGRLTESAYEKITLRHFGKGEISEVEPITGQAIRTLRDQARMSQAVFARHLKVTAGYVSQISDVAFGVPKKFPSSARPRAHEGDRLALGQNRGFGHGPSTARIASAACPLVFFAPYAVIEARQLLCPS